MANIREEEKKKLRELIQKSKDNLFNLSSTEFKKDINEIIIQIDKNT
jgi:hypothetical protein